jgi:hypothetical protein
LHTGVLLKLDLPNGGTSGAWKLAEELSKSVPEWLGALHVEQVSEVDGGIRIHFTCQEQWQGEVVAQCNLNHTFYIKDRGQFSVPNEVLCKELLRAVEYVVFPINKMILPLNENIFCEFMKSVHSSLQYQDQYLKINFNVSFQLDPDLPKSFST